MELTREIAAKVLGIVDHGLSHGLGTPEPGKLCVEAAVCLALGLPHGDNPPCVGYAVRSFKIRLNDSKWSSPEARAVGMRRLAIAQLGSDQVDQKEFARLIAEETIRQIVPIALRAAASIQKDAAHAMALEIAALRCEQEGTSEAALDAKTAADAAAHYGEHCSQYPLQTWFSRLSVAGSVPMKYSIRSALLSIALNAAFILAIAYELGWHLR